MVKLSDRLQMIADLIEVGETVADIGTDHGFLPIFLWESRKCPKIILADISSGSLQKAIDNVEMQINRNVFDFRLGNGIQVLENAEVDVVVIAGMGGILMAEILGDDLSKSKSFGRIILQPRNGQGKLRWWLLNNGFKIINEKLVREGKFICEIICAEKLDDCTSLVKLPEVGEYKQSKEAEHIKYEFPESILISNGALAVEFAEKKLQTEELVLESMKKATVINYEKVRCEQERIQYLKDLLNKYKEER